MSEAFDSEADFDLRRQLLNDPPWGGEHRLEPILNLIALADIKRFLAEYPVIETVHLGEVGTSLPNAVTRHFPDGSVHIVVSDGLIAFIDAIVQASMGAAVIGTADGIAEETALASDDVDRRLGELYAQWPELWKSTEIKVENVPLGEGVSELAAKIEKATMLFIIMHEYAHAVRHADVPVSDRNTDHELEADDWAVTQLMKFYGLPQNAIRLALVGAVVAVRAFAAIEIMGHRFPETYPPPRKRLDAIIGVFRKLCEDSAYTFYYYSTLAFAHDLRMEAAERQLQGLAYWPEPRADRIISTAMALLIHVWNRDMTLEAAEQIIRGEIERAPEGVRANTGSESLRAFGRAVPLYWKNTVEGKQAREIIDNFRGIVDRLPEKLRLHFMQGNTR